MEIEQGFVIVYAGMAFCGLGFALWAGWEWYKISLRCRVLESALEREKTRRPLRRETGDDPSVSAGGRDSVSPAGSVRAGSGSPPEIHSTPAPSCGSLYAREPDRGSLYARETDTSSDRASRGRSPRGGRIERGREAAR